MKLPILISIAIIFFFNKAKADQLAYITEKQAEKTTELIKNEKYVYLYCGCCDDSEKQLAEVINVEFKHTGYETYYEVILTYKDQKGNVKQEAIDLAYVWSVKNKKVKTVGQWLNLKHNPCKQIDI